MDESADATKTASRLDCEHHIVDFTGADARTLFPTFADEIDQPSIDGFNTWIISRAAAQNVKGVLSGLGGDEWFSGYPVVGRMLRAESTAAGRLRRAIAWVAHAVRKGIAPGRLLSRLDAAAAYRSRTALWCHPHTIFESSEASGLTEMPPTHASQTVRTTRFRRVLRFAADMEWSHESPIGAACLLDHFVFMMCRLLRDSDAASMASSLELRLPFVDVRIAEFSRSCRDDYKLTSKSAKQGRAKLVLQKALSDLLPAEVFNRPKRGFNLPNAHWMKNELSSLVRDVCDPAVVRRRGWLNPVAVQETFSRRSADIDSTPYPQLWSFMLLEMWGRAVFDRPLPSFHRSAAAEKYTSTPSLSTGTD